MTESYGGEVIEMPEKRDDSRQRRTTDDGRRIVRQSERQCGEMC